MAQNSRIKIEREVSVPGITMKELVTTYFDKAPTILNLDLEGMEMLVLESIDFETWRPLIYIIETIPYRSFMVVEEKREDIVSFMQSKDYAEYAFTGINSIFVDKRQVR